jgi:iron complex transport system substrate-binding protein
MRFRSSFPSALALFALVVAGCGSSDSPTTTGEESATGADGTFPARVEHKFGATTVPSKPKRIVVVGFTEQDTVLALGEKPIAVSEWYGEQPYATWPWARDELGSAKPTVLNNGDGFQYEKIAALRPDLILGPNAGMKKGDYEKLSKLAPTIPAAKDSHDWFSDWDEQVELIAAALGKPAEGSALIKRVRDGYAQAAADHPEFKGKTATFVQNGFYDGLIYAYQDGLNTDFLTMLGFEINPKLTPLVENSGEQVGISEERLDVIDADTIVFATEKPADLTALKKVPTFGKLGAVADKRAVYTDGTLAGAMYFMTPLSLEYVLEKLTPQLEAAVAGKAPRKVGAE